MKKGLILILLAAAALSLMACNPTGGYASDGNYASGGNAMGSGYYASNGSAIIYASSGDAQPYLIATSGNAQPLSPTPTPQP